MNKLIAITIGDINGIGIDILIKTWKDKMDDVASPSQIKTALQEIEELKEFKTRSVTIFMVVQFLMAAAIGLSKIF